MFLQYLQTDPQFYFSWVITVVLSICIHELAHGVVAVWLGDRTPIETGHMTPNPVVHMGGIAVIALVVSGIAWGLMPVDRTRLRGRHGDAIVSIAGPLSNLLLALLSLVGLGLWLRFGDVHETGTRAGNLQNLMWVFGYANIVLCLLNLLPVPPLDGSSVLASFNRPYAQWVEKMRSGGATFILLIAVFMLSPKLLYPWANGLAERVVRLASVGS